MTTAIKVILTEDSTAGRAGELVKVKMGYARNFLLPKGLAVVADVVNIKAYEEKKAELERIAEEKRSNAEAIKEKLGEETVILITAKAGDSGKLFGAVTKEKLVQALDEQIKVKVSKDNITIKNPIKSLGLHEVTLNLGSNISTDVTIKVENEAN